MRGDTADAGVDLVEHERLSSGDGRECERDPRELASRRRLGGRCEWKAGVRPHEEDGLVGTRCAGIAVAELDEKLAVAHPERLQLGGDRFGERHSRGSCSPPRSSSARAAMRAWAAPTASSCRLTGS